MNWNVAYSLILFSVTGITFWGGLLFDKERKNKKIFVSLFAVLALIPLLVFKYYNFITASGISMLESMGLHFSLPGLNWAVPMGISFYTFQALGYMWDVYYGKIKAERNFLDYLLFCSFFPQTASGPISKASELLPQIKQYHPFDYAQGVQGLKLLLWGMFLKVVVADRLSLYIDMVYANYEHFSGLNCLLSSVFYSIQIYGDFAGYSLMAVGIGKMLGFDLVNNFERPYLATSITDFWKRWHISLTRWLTAYIYIPLGGNRCSKFRQYMNILATFLVSGLWHGANWTFVIWGAIHGCLQVAEKECKNVIWGGENSLHRIPAFFKIFLTFFLVNFAWVFFRMPTASDAIVFITRIFSDFSGQAILFKMSNTDKLFCLLAFLIWLVVELKWEYAKDKWLWLDKCWLKWGFYLFLFCLILTIGVLDASSFIYVSF